MQGGKKGVEGVQMRQERKGKDGGEEGDGAEVTWRKRRKNISVGGKGGGAQ